MELLVVVAVLLAVFGLALLLRIKDQRQAAAKKLDQLTAATRGYIEALEQNRVFAPVVAVPGLHLEQKEFAVRCDRATLAEFRQARIGGGVGTRDLRIEIIGGAKAPIADAPIKRGILGTPSQKGDGNQNLI